MFDPDPAISNRNGTSIVPASRPALTTTVASQRPASDCARADDANASTRINANTFFIPCSSKQKARERVERFRACYWLNVFVLDGYRGANGGDAALSRPERTPATQHEQFPPPPARCAGSGVVSPKRGESTRRAKADITFMPAHLSPTPSLL